jgi:membrane protease YdiL (CAAX protease family)
MSILAAAEAATQPTMGQQMLLFGPLLLVGLTIAVAAGVFRRGSIRGPERLGEDAPRGGLFAVMFVGVFVWLGTQMGIGLSARVRYEATAATKPFGIDAFTAADYALLATIPGAVGVIVFLVGDALVSRQTFRRLGLTLGQFVPGFLRAFVGTLILLPVIFFASIALEMLYRQIGYEHPGEHDLLRVMKEVADPIHRILLIVGATLVAPVFEEMLFRGHLQSLVVTWIRDIVHRIREPRAAPRRFPVVTSNGGGLPAGSVGQGEAIASPASVEGDNVHPVWGLWIGVIITSLLFAIIHPLWSVPMIFLLSLGLGYAYERTGNLWVPLVIHLLFNSFNTALFLLLPSQN